MRDLTIVFDLDGTLVDTAPDLVAATNHVLDHLDLPPVAEDHLRPWIGHGAKYMIEHAIGEAGRKLAPYESERLLERYLDYYGTNIAVGSRPFEDAVPSLQRFRDAGAKLAVCTNKMERMSTTLLDALELTPLFEVVAGRDTFANFKPHPDHLLDTIRQAGGDAGRAIMIGDSAVDVATAKAAGVPVIAVSFGYTDVPAAELGADSVIGHYRELEPAILSLLRK